MPDEMEYRYFEIRAEGRRLSGVALVYGDTARTPFGEEVFEAGAFGDVANLDVLLNVQHQRSRPLARTGGGGLVLTDTPEALTVTADLPNTREADDALALVEAGILRGLSIEFGARRERQEGRRRIVQTALLGGLALVDRPAYPASTVAARAEETKLRRRQWL